MALVFDWPKTWDPAFEAATRGQVQQRLRDAMAGAAGMPIRGSAVVEELSFGSVAPDVKVTRIDEAGPRSTRIEVLFRYAGDACISVRGLEINLDLSSPSVGRGDRPDASFDRRSAGDANHSMPFFCPFGARIHTIVLEARLNVELRHDIVEDPMLLPVESVATAQPHHHHNRHDHSNSNHRGSSHHDLVVADAPSERPRVRVGQRLPSAIVLEQRARAGAARGSGDVSDDALSDISTATATRQEPTTGQPRAAAAAAARTPQWRPGQAGMAAAVLAPGPMHPMGAAHHRLGFGGAQMAARAVQQSQSPRSAVAGAAGAAAHRTVARQPPTFARLVRNSKEPKAVPRATRRLLKLQSFDDPLRSFEVESNFNSIHIAADQVKAQLRSSLTPVIQTLMEAGVQIALGC